MVNRKEEMKINLSESLRELVIKEPFEKIIIKKICDQAGVIRATFYNYYVDKYDCLNHIIFFDFIENVFEENKNKSIDSVIYDLISIINLNKQFYRNIFRFKDYFLITNMIEDNLKILLNEYLNDNNIDHGESQKSICKFHANSLTYIIESWLVDEYSSNIDEIHSKFRKLESINFEKAFSKN